MKNQIKKIGKLFFLLGLTLYLLAMAYLAGWVGGTNNQGDFVVTKPDKVFAVIFFILAAVTIGFIIRGIIKFNKA